MVLSFFPRIHGTQAEGFKSETGLLANEVLWAPEGDAQGEARSSAPPLYRSHCVIPALDAQENSVCRSAVSTCPIEICERCEMCTIFLAHISLLVLQELPE